MRYIYGLLIISCTLSACSGGSNNSNNTSNNNTQVNSAPTTTIAGVVADKNGNPVNGATITAFLTNTNTAITTTTNGQGMYSFSGLSSSYPYGGYEIRAEKTGYAFYPNISSNNGTITKADYNALYRTVISVPSFRQVNANDVNFTAYIAGDKLVNLPRTGQIASYTSGDDGSVHAGVALPSTRFADNNDGTVTDNLTGLIWLKDAGCIAPSTWNAALTIVSQLANGSCGLSDGSTTGKWRMPNSGELESIIDIAFNTPALTAGHPFTNIGNTYWTSTTYRGVTTEAWVIRLSDGRYINDGAGNVKTTSLNATWAVKSASVTGTIKLPATGQFITYGANDDATAHNGMDLTSPRFIDKGDGTVTDTVTGLIWMKKADCIHLQWVDAIAAVNALSNGQCALADGSTAGQWHMPNRAELLSLVDRAETNQALRFNTVFLKVNGSVDQSAIFNNFLELEFYWTSSTDAADTTMAWTVFSCDYGVYDIAKANVGYTLAVR